jgi:uncharacterized protein (DUF302 family)
MPPMQLLIFGNPKSGTPLMIASPSIAPDLPLKALRGKTRREKFGSHTMYRNILKRDTGFQATCLTISSGARALIEHAAE